MNQISKLGLLEATIVLFFFLALVFCSSHLLLLWPSLTYEITMYEEFPLTFWNIYCFPYKCQTLVFGIKLFYQIKYWYKLSQRNSVPPGNKSTQKLLLELKCLNCVSLNYNFCSEINTVDAAICLIHIASAKLNKSHYSGENSLHFLKSSNIRLVFFKTLWEKPELASKKHKPIPSLLLLFSFVLKRKENKNSSGFLSGHQSKCLFDGSRTIYSM